MTFLFEHFGTSEIPSQIAGVAYEFCAGQVCEYVNSVLESGCSAIFIQPE